MERFSSKTSQNKKTGMERFSCETCQKTFSCKRSFRQHQKRHLRNTPQFFCSQCSKKYRDASTLREHTQITHQRLPLIYSCSFCPNTFVHRKSWKRHERRHRGYRTHVCSFCSMTFVTKYDMERHRSRTHTQSESPVNDPKVEQWKKLVKEKEQDEMINTLSENAKDAELQSHIQKINNKIISIVRI